MHPPHRPKRNKSGRKISLNFGEDLFFFFFFWRPPDFGQKKRLNFRFRPKNQSQFWWRPFFFFFFFFWRPPDFGHKKRLNFRFRPKNQSQFWWRPFFFFFFFLETTWFWAKKTFEFPISAEKSVSILVKTSEFLRFWLQIPPHQNFLDPPLLVTSPLKLEVSIFILGLVKWTAMSRFRSDKRASSYKVVHGTMTQTLVPSTHDTLWRQ